MITFYGPPKFEVRIYPAQLAIAIATLEQASRVVDSRDRCQLSSQQEYAAGELRDALARCYGKIFVDHLMEQAEATVADPSIVPPWELPPEET
jgi:hypothetical protein